MKRAFEPKLSWNSGRDDLINDFFKPALVNCKLYQRLSGYFSSTTFASVAMEIIDFIESGGKIQLITGPEVSEADKVLLEQSVLEREKILSDNFLEDLKDDPDNIKLDFSKLMAYMLGNIIDGKPQLEIKIAIPKKGPGIYHQKIGIMKYDNGEKIVFAGSVNETWMGWNENIENFTVFCSWKENDTDAQGIIDNQMDFNDLWNNNNSNIYIFDLPQSVKEQLLKIRPKSDEELKKIIQKIKQRDQSNISKLPDKPSKSRIQLKDHQTQAINKWTENNCRGLLEMATGAGKTFTAFGCMNKIQRSHARTLIVIACPQLHLVEQWKSAIRKWNEGVETSEKIMLVSEVTCNSDYYNWKTEFENKLYDFTNPLLGSQNFISNHMVIFTTHDTLALSSFAEKLPQVDNIEQMLVIDEVHNVTEESSPKKLLENFNFRLGLSATPVRHLDEQGTKILKNYFEGIVYVLDLETAIKQKILCPYQYFPYYVELSQNEMEEYRSLTASIAQIEAKKKKGTYHPKPGDFNPYLGRANLIANAENKDSKLKEILEIEFSNRLDHTLIYCTNNPSMASKDSPKQLERVQTILSERGITSDSVTWKDKTHERLDILMDLKKGHLDCVTAINCLDEGVDVPHVHTGIFMASSGNPRQFIQRRGRILRKNEATNKTSAFIHDILVMPPVTLDMGDDFSLIQRKLAAKELLRHKEFASIATNKSDAIHRIKPIAEKFGIDFNALDYNYVLNMT